MYGHSREVFFFEIRVGLSAKDLCEAWALHNFGRLCLMRIRRQIRTSQKKERNNDLTQKNVQKRDSFFFVRDFANVKLCCFQVKKYHCSGSRWQIWENNDEVCWFSEIPSTFSFVLWKWPLASVRFSETKKLTDSDFVKTQKKRRKTEKRIKVDKRHLFYSFYTHFYILLWGIFQKTLLCFAYFPCFPCFPPSVQYAPMRCEDFCLHLCGEVIVTWQNCEVCDVCESTRKVQKNEENIEIFLSGFQIQGLHWWWPLWVTPSRSNFVKKFRGFAVSYLTWMEQPS